MSLKPWIVLVFRTVVGGVFLWAGMLKVLDPLAFARGIEAYHVFPRPAAFFLALLRLFSTAGSPPSAEAGGASVSSLGSVAWFMRTSLLG